MRCHILPHYYAPAISATCISRRSEIGAIRISLVRACCAHFAHTNQELKATCGQDACGIAVELFGDNVVPQLSGNYFPGLLVIRPVDVRTSSQSV